MSFQTHAALSGPTEGLLWVYFFRSHGKHYVTYKARCEYITSRNMQWRNARELCLHLNIIKEAHTVTISTKKYAIG